MSEATKPNIKRKIADTFGHPVGWFASSVATAVLSLAIVPAVVDDNAVTPDAVGTAMEESVMAQHQADFSALQDMKADIALMEAQNVLIGDSEELTALKKDFGKQAVNAYTDLYLDGATQDGAAISEQNFEQLRQRFAETIIDPAALGFQTEIAPGMLDETLAQTTLNADTETDRYTLAQNIDKQLAAAQNDDSIGPYGIAGLTAGGIAGLLLILSITMGINWCNEPKRVPVRKPKKSTPYGKH